MTADLLLHYYYLYHHQVRSWCHANAITIITITVAMNVKYYMLFRDVKTMGNRGLHSY